jgi:ring-1,2-phenylacetyl-CoA epoxidase subunit PaaB
MESLDPRINRWKINPEGSSNKEALDQLVTFEVFLQMREGRAFEHAGIVHASGLEMAFIFAKEQFSRRYTCTGMWVVATADLTVTEYTDLEENVYDLITDQPTQPNEEVQTYEVFHLLKRGKQHKHVGQVEASGPQQALYEAKKAFNDDSPVLNIWIGPTKKFLISQEQDKVIWSTLKEKKHREVISYKAADKLKAYKERTQ